ncbi:MAG TPA: hypothetical protein VGM78_01360 [Ilumatobacteraceae bacterium]
MPRYRSKRGEVYSAAERAHLIATFHVARAERERAAGADDDAAAAELTAQMLATSQTYESATPIVSLSRCPFTGDVYETSLDLFGLEGMWWAYDHDYRPYVAPIPTFFAWSGSMQLDGPVIDMPLTAMVGPTAPFVTPRMLEHPALRAVISSVLIGEHVGFPVVYFAAPTPNRLQRVNDWGHNSCSFVGATGAPARISVVEDDTEKDIDIARWIREGKLLWIEPGDIDLRLRSTIDDCPFLDVGGDRNRQYIREGHVWVAHDTEIEIPD